jgi:two-component system response regulator
MTPHATANEKLNVLIAEDSEMDRWLLREAFAELDFNVALIFVGDGEELFEYLRGTKHLPAAAPTPLPALILMDLNMPRMKGLDALKALRADALLRALPVIVLSTSSNPKQIAQAYASGGNAYMTKPAQFNDLLDAMQKFGDFWLTVSRLPDPSALANPQERP